MVFCWIFEDFLLDQSNVSESLDSIFEACRSQKCKDEILQALSTDSSCHQVMQSKV